MENSYEVTQSSDPLYKNLFKVNTSFLPIS